LTIESKKLEGEKRKGGTVSLNFKACLHKYFSLILVQTQCNKKTKQELFQFGYLLVCSINIDSNNKNKKSMQQNAKSSKKSLKLGKHHCCAATC